MINQIIIRERYLRDKLPIRLGGLAANLTFSDTDMEDQAVLAELQIQLALWQRRWGNIWTDPIQRAAVAEKAHNWSKRVLEMSGILQ